MATVALIASIGPCSASNGAYNVEVTKDYVSCTAKCSCSLSDGSYKYSTNTFVNKCPNCGGKLVYECMSYWVEGIYVCTSCDMDFCCVHGKSHDNRGYYLKRTTKAQYQEPKPVEVQAITVIDPVIIQKIVLNQEYKITESQINHIKASL